jgi:polyhydroxyalkanoate synthesis repressor PhaR
MRIIKRYPNRKLYDTEAKQYITLEGIAALIRQQDDVRVIDHASGEDLTAVTLTQIILEQEKKRDGFLPRTVLTGLIQAGGDTLSSLRRTLASPLELARHVDEEIERRIQALVSRGEMAADEGLRLRDKLLAQGQRSSGSPRLDDQALEEVLVKRGVPTRKELQQVLGQLDELTAQLESLAEHADATRGA